MFVGFSSYAFYKYTSAGVYTGTSFSVASEDTFPVAITWDGGHLWVLGYQTDTVYKYSGTAVNRLADYPDATVNTLGVYSGTSFSVASQDGNSYGITWDGTHFWVVGHGGKRVYKYTSAGVYTGTSFSVSSQESFPQGITWDGTHFWVIGDSSDSEKKYTSAGVKTGTRF